MVLESFYSAPSPATNGGSILPEWAGCQMFFPADYGCCQADGVCHRQTLPSESALLLMHMCQK